MHRKRIENSGKNLFFVILESDSDVNSKHGKCRLTNLLPKFAIQVVQGDNRYNLKVMHNVLRIHESRKNTHINSATHTDQTQKEPRG